MGESCQERISLTDIYIMDDSQSFKQGLELFLKISEFLSGVANFCES